MAEPVNLDDFRQKPAQRLETSGGGGDSTGMEARVSKLEVHMEHVRNNLGDIKTDVSKVKTDVTTLLERVAHLPSKGYTVTTLLLILAAVAALTLLGPNIQRMIGVVPLGATPGAVVAPLPKL